MGLKHGDVLVSPKGDPCRIVNTGDGGLAVRIRGGELRDVASPDLVVLYEAEANKPVFPRVELRDPASGEGIREGYDGVTLRDWYASQFAAGMLGMGISQLEEFKERAARHQPAWRDMSLRRFVAEWSCEMADEMLAVQSGARP